MNDGKDTEKGLLLKSTEGSSLRAQTVDSTPSQLPIRESNDNNKSYESAERKSNQEHWINEIRSNESGQNGQVSTGTRIQDLEFVDTEQNQWREKQKKERCSCLKRTRKSIRSKVTSKYFDRFIILAIIINTIVMGIEHHGQSELITNLLEYSNLFFTVLFFFEMLLKLIGEGCLKYIKNPYNLFDGTIVIISLIELYQTKSGLMVLRTFRLLRVLKLVRFMPGLRHQLVSAFVILLSIRAVNK